MCLVIAHQFFPRLTLPQAFTNETSLVRFKNVYDQDVPAIVSSSAVRTGATSPLNLYRPDQNANNQWQARIGNDGTLTYGLADGLTLAKGECPVFMSQVAEFIYNPSRNTGVAEHGELLGKKGQRKIYACERKEADDGVFDISISSNENGMDGTLKDKCQRINIKTHSVDLLDFSNLAQSQCDCGLVSDHDGQCSADGGNDNNNNRDEVDKSDGDDNCSDDDGSDDDNNSGDDDDSDPPATPLEPTTRPLTFCEDEPQVCEAYRNGGINCDDWAELCRMAEANAPLDCVNFPEQCDDLQQEAQQLLASLQV